MILPCQQIINEKDIAKRLLNGNLLNNEKETKKIIPY
jgi:hypothetical protein